MSTEESISMMSAPNPSCTHFFPLPTHICGMCVCVCVYPTTNGGMQNGSSVDIHTHCVHVFARFGADLYVQSVLIDKICASELSRKFIESVLLVGSVLPQLSLVLGCSTALGCRLITDARDLSSLPS